MSAQCIRVTRDLMKTFMSKFDTVLFDCDGVLWLSSTIIPRAAETIELLKKQGKRIFFITNNSTKTRADYLKKLISAGFSAKLDEIVCTAHVTAVHLKNRHFKDKVYLIGPKALEDELTECGIKWIKHEDVLESGATIETAGKTMENDPEVKCVVVGADVHFNYVKMCRACQYLYGNEQCLFIGTNPDAQYPSGNGKYTPGTGSIIAAVACAAGRQPTYIGKPEKPIFDFLRETYNIDASRTIMVGDRLGTDIKLASNNGLLSLLVLTGMHNLEDVAEKARSTNPEEKSLVPDFYIESVTQWAEYMADS